MLDLQTLQSMEQKVLIKSALMPISGLYPIMECGSDLNEIVLCDPVTKDLAVLDCYCVTYQYSSEGEPMFPVVGGCVFNCVNHTRSGYANIYHSAPSDCASLNRQGTLWTVSGWLYCASIIFL